MAITFTRTTQTLDESTGQVTPTETTIEGSAIRVRGNPNRYVALGLNLQKMPTLLFTPDAYGDTPEVGDKVTWPETDGDVYAVQDVDVIAPDGVTIAARVVIGK